MGCNSSKVSDTRDVTGAHKSVGRKETPEVDEPHIEVPQDTVSNEEAVDENANEDYGTVQTTRLLLLGAAESGKTTVLEQIRLLYKQNYTEAELLHRKTFIYENIVSSMTAMLDYMNKVGEQLSNSENEQNVHIIRREMEGTFSCFTEAQFNALKSLWNDEGVQRIYSRRGEYNLNDSTAFFFENLERINTADFSPTPKDIIMAYCPTAGVQNVNFTVNNHTFQLFDFGGQKNDRRKWPLMYDGITAVIFCIAISEYDQKLSEDGVTNRLLDAFHLLKLTCAEPKFKSTWIFVFLNEVDVLCEKLVNVPFKDYIDNYDGDGGISSVKLYLEKTVKELCGNRQLSRIEFTCAIDTVEMKKILEKTFKLLENAK